MAVNFKVTEVEEVYAEPPLINMDPVGGEMSFAPTTPNIGDKKSIVPNRNSAADKNFLFKATTRGDSHKRVLFEIIKDL